MKLPADDAAIRDAAQRLARGELVAFPTETVYGLGARADDDAAVATIFARKQRPADHPLIVHVEDADAAHAFAEGALPAAAQALMRTCWPGPLTLIVPRREGIAEAAAGGHRTIGLRCPSHPVARALLREARALGVPGLAAPSANRFGRVSPTSADHVIDEFGDDVLVLDGGACDVGIESAIVDCSRLDADGRGAVLLRPGAWSRDELARRSGVVIAAADEADASAPRASGTLESHYAPRATVRLMDTTMLRQALDILGAEGMPKLAVYSRTVRPPSKAVILRRMPDTARATAHELFATLREFDAAGATLVWIEQPPDDAEWDGVRDRLQRASAPH